MQYEKRIAYQVLDQLRSRLEQRVIEDKLRWGEGLGITLMPMGDRSDEHMPRYMRKAAWSWTPRDAEGMLILRHPFKPVVSTSFLEHRSSIADWGLFPTHLDAMWDGLRFLEGVKAGVPLKNDSLLWHYFGTMERLFELLPPGWRDEPMPEYQTPFELME